MAACSRTWRSSTRRCPVHGDGHRSRTQLVYYEIGPARRACAIRSRSPSRFEDRRPRTASSATSPARSAATDGLTAQTTSASTTRTPSGRRTSRAAARSARSSAGSRVRPSGACRTSTSSSSLTCTPRLGDAAGARDRRRLRVQPLRRTTGFEATMQGFITDAFRWNNLGAGIADRLAGAGVVHQGEQARLVLLARQLRLRRTSTSSRRHAPRRLVAPGRGTQVVDVPRDLGLVALEQRELHARLRFSRRSRCARAGDQGTRRCSRTRRSCCSRRRRRAAIRSARASRRASSRRRSRTPTSSGRRPSRQLRHRLRLQERPHHAARSTSIRRRRRTCCSRLGAAAGGRVDAAREHRQRAQPRRGGDARRAAVSTRPIARCRSGLVFSVERNEVTSLGDAARSSPPAT